MIALTRAAARELGPDRVRVNAIAPGLIMTENLRDHPSYRGAVVDAIVSGRAIQREAVPEDVVGTLLYLVSPQSEFVTGTLEGVPTACNNPTPGATSMTVLCVLWNAASNAASGGTPWYGSSKTLQVVAKDAFDAINNEVVFAT